MSELKAAIDSLSTTETKLFGGVYSHQEFDLYDAEHDELGTSISALIDSTVQIFSLNIRPVQVQGHYRTSYDVDVRYFKLMGDSAVVSGDLLLDFLLNAKIVIEHEPAKLYIIYVPSA